MSTIVDNNLKYLVFEELLAVSTAMGSHYKSKPYIHHKRKNMINLINLTMLYKIPISKNISYCLQPLILLLFTS